MLEHQDPPTPALDILHQLFRPEGSFTHELSGKLIELQSWMVDNEYGPDAISRVFIYPENDDSQQKMARAMFRQRIQHLQATGPVIHIQPSKIRPTSPETTEERDLLPSIIQALENIPNQPKGANFEMTTCSDLKKPNPDHMSYAMLKL